MTRIINVIRNMLLLIEKKNGRVNDLADSLII